MKLRPYQEQAADFLYEHDRAMILAPVGAGKTAITLTAMDEFPTGDAVRFLVVAPLRVATSVWPVEAAKWAPSLKVRVAVGTPAQRIDALYDSDADVVIINYENLQWLGDHALNDFTGVVFDELTRLKNPSGKRFKAMEKIVMAIEIRWGLTGSFTSNGLEDVFGQAKIIDQSLLGRTKGAFMQQHFFQYNRGTHVEWEAMPGALQRVMQKIKPATYLLEPGQYKDTLPPLHTVEVPLQMEMREYDAMRKNFVLEFPDETAIAQNAAVVTQKLQQLASGFVYTGTQERWLSTHKLDALTDLLAENQRAPTIVWYQYVAEREALQRAFPKAVDVKAAGAIDDWNAGKIEVLLAHPASAGHGLNLQHGGCRMVWLTLPWSLELYEQAVGRLHRSGQAHDVWCYVLLTHGTIDHKIWAALRDKRSLSDIALEALK
ncbi:MAG: SNF2-related protein [Alphaproteobacteria bacterium]